MTRAAPVPSAMSKVVRSPLVPFQSAAAALLSVIDAAQRRRRADRPAEARRAAAVEHQRERAVDAAGEVEVAAGRLQRRVGAQVRLPARIVPLPSARPTTCDGEAGRAVEHRLRHLQRAGGAAIPIASAGSSRRDRQVPLPRARVAAGERVRLQRQVGGAARRPGERQRRPGQACAPVNCSAPE